MLTGVVVVVVVVGVVGVDTCFKKLHSSQFAIFLSEYFFTGNWDQCLQLLLFGFLLVLFSPFLQVIFSTIGLALHSTGTTL